MFKVGEETGTLDNQLAIAAMYFDRELEQRSGGSPSPSSR